MTVDTVDAIREMTLEKIDKFRQERLDGMTGDIESSLGSHRDVLSRWSEWWTTWVDIGKWAFPIAVEEMGRVADAMGWPCLVPKWFTTRGFWAIQWIMGYESRMRKAEGDGRPWIVKNMVTAVAVVNVWCDDGSVPNNGFCADVGFGFGDCHYQFVSLAPPAVDSEASFRAACREAILGSYREYMESGEYIPTLERWMLEADGQGDN